MALLLTTALVSLLLIREPGRQLAAAGLYGLLCVGVLLSSRFERRPALMQRYMFAQTTLVIGLALVQPGLFTFIFPAIILTAQAAMTLPLGAAVGWAAIYMFTVLFGAVAVGGWVGALNALLNLLGFPVALTFGRMMRAAEEARGKNQLLLEELQAAQGRLQEMAVAEERNRLARDLHDSARQQAFAVSAQLDAARLLLQRDPQGAEAHLIQAEQLADDLRQELASLILELRPPELAGQGLADALPRYLAAWSRQSGVAAEARVAGGVGPLPDEVELALFRIAQEALSNIARHSRAHRAEVSLARAGAGLRLTVRDDGQGFEPAAASSGFGMRSMRERAVGLPGGALSVESAPGEGTQVNVSCRVS
jgi:signal transduction histidine kinase